jgi:hypothetical protein
MKFPRVHLFVDAKCPALVSGKITGWAAPSKLVAMIGTGDVQRAPDGSSPAGALRWWREGCEPSPPEVQIIIEGELMAGLLLGLGEHVRDIYYFADKEAMDKAETFERIYTQYRDFQSLICEAVKAFEGLDAELSKLDPEYKDLNLSGSMEIVAELDLGDSPSIPGLLFELADRYAAELSPAKSLELKAA